jgi:hypothetical protein
MEKLSCGPILSLVQNTIYALPPHKCTLFTSAAAPTIQQSTSATFADNATVTLTAGASEVVGAFLRVTSAGPTPAVLRRA